MNNTNKPFAEQIRIVIDTQSVEAQTKGITRIAELGRKGYKIIETWVQDNEQNYLLEKAS